MSAVFISHSSADREAADELLEWLNQLGHRSVFLDFDPERGVPAGRSWEQELYQQMRICRAVIVVCSRSSMASKWCFAELTQARAQGKALLPVRIDDCTIDSLIAEHQVADLTGNKADGFKRLGAGLVAAGLDPSDVFEWDATRAPYPGLMSFEEKDAAVFFGREDEIGAAFDLLKKLRRLGSADVALVLGASGSGKSSLVRAGLVPRLRRDSERWLVIDPFRPRDDPVRELAGTLSKAFAAAGEPRARSSIADEIYSALGSTDPTKRNPMLETARALRIVADRSDPTVLLVIDQFEELLGFGPEHTSTRLVTLLRTAAEAADSPLLIIATLRSDFLGAFQNSPMVADMRTESLLVGPLSIGDVAEIIERPALVGGVELEPGLVQSMVADAGGGGALPLVAFTLRELYETCGPGHRFDLATYRDRLGGLQGAVAWVAEGLVEEGHLAPDEEVDLRRAFLSMVRLTEDERWVRRVARWDDLPASIQPVLARLVAARLLVAGGDDGSRTIEVAHEALFRSWGRLVVWLDQSTATLRLHRDLQLASTSWQRDERDPAHLWRGARLASAVELANSGELPLDEQDRMFVEASEDVAHAEQSRDDRRRRRRLQAAVAVAIGATVLALVASVFFVRAQRESDRANDQARLATALALASSARGELDENPALALVLAAESSITTATPLPQATDALIRARLAFSRRPGQQLGGPLTGHSGPAIAVAFNADGDLLASAGGDETVRLWDPATGEQVGEPLTGHDGEVFDVAFSRDGALLASTGVDGTVRLWDPITGKQIGEPLTGHGGPLHEVAFSSDGALVAATAREGTAVELWDPATGQPAGDPLPCPSDDGEDSMHLVFSPVGRVLACGQTIIRLWDPDTRENIGELEGDSSGVNELAFSADGTLLAGAGSDGMLSLWDPITGETKAELANDEETSFFAVAFSHDSDVVAAADGDIIRLWDRASDGRAGAALTGHDGLVVDVAFSPSGVLLASAGVDGTIRLWNVAPGVPVGEPVTGEAAESYAVALNREGTLLASADWDDTIRLWDPATGRPDGRPLTGTDTGFGVALSPDGSLVASTGDDGTVRLWSTATREQVGRPLTGHTGAVVAVAFNPDGTLLASADNDGTVRLWDPVSGEQLGRALTGHDGAVWRVSFSSDGKLLASAGADRTVRLWSTATREQVGEPLTGHTGAVVAVAFSPDGTLLASGGDVDDTTVRLWDPATGEPVGEPLLGHTDGVSAVSFSPDGRLLVSAGEYDAIRLWDVANREPIGEPLTGDSSDIDERFLDVAISLDGTVLVSGGSMGVRLWRGVWDVAAACQLAAPYVTDAQIQAYLPAAARPHACESS